MKNNEDSLQESTSSQSCRQEFGLVGRLPWLNCIKHPPYSYVSSPGLKWGKACFYCTNHIQDTNSSPRRLSPVSDINSCNPQIPWHSMRQCGQMPDWVCWWKKTAVIRLTFCYSFIVLSGLSLALNKEGCDWQDRHSARANSGRATHLSQTRYTPLVEVNQAIKAWSF